jgi:hypothetical protein
MQTIPRWLVVTGDPTGGSNLLPIAVTASYAEAERYRGEPLLLLDGVVPPECKPEAPCANWPAYLMTPFEVERITADDPTEIGLAIHREQKLCSAEPTCAYHRGAA